MNPNSGLELKLLLTLAVIGAACVSHSLQAGSATWSLTPQSGDWYAATNWVPESVPNGPDDVATFDGFSSILDITFPPGSTTVLDSVIIHSAPFYGITVGNQSSLTFVGSGSFLVGSFAADHLQAAAGGTLSFTNSSVSEAGVKDSGTVYFQGKSRSTSDVDVYGGDNASPGGVVIFSDQASAAGVVNALPSFGYNKGGAAYFNDDSTADQLLLGVYGDGFADISGHHPPGLAIDTPYADGTIFLGANNLTVTRHSVFSDVFPGKLVDGGASGGKGGSLTKAGQPDTNVTLTGSSSYTGGTTITGGMLYIVTGRGSTPTGTGDVHVKGGGFGGKGNVQGNVIVGTGAGTPASLIPGKHGSGVGSLWIRRTLTFADDGILGVNINSKNGNNGRVSARGITINSGAQIELIDRSNVKIATGSVLTLLNNTAGTPIAGSFANLPDGGTIAVNANTYQANYEGGDGNDLTLTVIN